MHKTYKKVILHCGIHKTGSSYLQSLFKEQAGVLGKHGIEYPDFRNPASPHSGNHSITAVHYRGETDTLAYLGKFLRLKFSHPTLLISGEEFSRPHILKPFLTNLIGQAPDMKVQVIFYLRRFDHLLESVYSESVKRTLVGGVERAAYELDFTKIVQPAVERTGVNNVILRPYNKALWRRGVLGADFLEAIGVPEAFDEITEASNAELNVSLSRTHTFILSCLSQKESKQKMIEFFQRKKLDAPDTSRYFMTPQRRNTLNKNHLFSSHEYFLKLGIEDFAKFLGIEDTIDEPNWTPFAPNMDIITPYMEEFINEGNPVDMGDFMGEVKKRTQSNILEEGGAAAQRAQ